MINLTFIVFYWILRYSEIIILLDVAFAFSVFPGFLAIYLDFEIYLHTLFNVDQNIPSFCLNVRSLKMPFNFLVLVTAVLSFDFLALARGWTIL